MFTAVWCAVRASRIIGPVFFLSEPVSNQPRNSPYFREREGSLLYSQVPATCPCLGPDLSNPCSHIPFLNIHPNIILPSTSGSSKWALSLIFPHQNPVCTSSVLHTRRCSRRCSYVLRPTRKETSYSDQTR